MGRIVVIGAGMGAMAAAARLATVGHRVTVYERGETYGGGVRRYERDGFCFDTGPGLLQLPAVWRDLFIKTGREPLEDVVELRQTDPAARHLFADGTEVTLPAASRAGVIDALDTALGAGSGERWAALVGRARTAWDATRRPLLEEPLTDATDRTGRQWASRDPYPALRKRGMLRRRTPTLSEVGRDELRDPRLVALLESYATAYGLDPQRVPASATVLAYLEQTFGSWYVTGGMRALADAVRQRCVARGVEFVFGAEVVRSLAKDGRTAGVELADGTVVDADVVIDGGCPYPESAPGQARLTVLLALRGARPEGTAHRTVVHGSERTLTVLRPEDAVLVPDAGHEAVTLTVPVEPFSPVGEEDVRRLITDAEAAVPGLRDRLRWHAVRTPADNARETGAPGGAVPAPALAGADGAYLRAANQGGLKGLYAVGGWAHPGGGLAHAGMSGAMAAGLIVEGAGWRGSR
ncbi:phytoene desaturase family protein [Streptomyces gobiensis]|uniref:phytoene desaturase family protein n=1 Tax=Streptomyces gobiensis TaxID=2875706 RepID=UPI001E377E2E|nr:NAD(P)/FAD-dependent oxidoreductase [Streptomyces gobiensis]UGY90892.1 NAD(P)/FAD-dependent oxidoreductase [Streptomyces gobiensis]